MEYYDNKCGGFSSKKIIGNAIIGSTIGMAAYHLPISKNAFVEEAFDVTKKSAEKDILDLKQAAKEVKDANISEDSKLILQRLSVSESYDAIINKCKNLFNSVNDSDKVKALKKDFADGFKEFKKNASSMDKNTAQAMNNLKWNHFTWGMIIGACIGIGTGMFNSRD
ncbi:hypothetical protein J6E39_01370 [bacterium]|nr:hypothetical protein [bacterium]